jgi:hypothetical protein
MFCNGFPKLTEEPLEYRTAKIKGFSALISKDRLEKFG